LIEEGVALVARGPRSATVGPYRLQAAIAAVHDEAASAEETDWGQILALYDVLAQVAPGPAVTLNRAVAVAMVRGPADGLRELEPLDADDRMRRSHRLEAVRAHLLEMAGEDVRARESYLLAARMTASIPEQRYLTLKAARLERS
jgi:predicted RNA polymerase sigma factor